MNNELTHDQLRDKLNQLFVDAGYSVPELLTYIEQLEQKNKALGAELKKIKAAAQRQQPSSKMNSRLLDALRE